MRRIMMLLTAMALMMVMLAPVAFAGHIFGGYEHKPTYTCSAISPTTGELMYFKADARGAKYYERNFDATCTRDPK